MLESCSCPCSRCACPATIGSTGVWAEAGDLQKSGRLPSCSHTHQRNGRSTRTNGVTRGRFSRNFCKPLLSKCPPLVAILRDPWKGHVLTCRRLVSAVVDSTETSLDVDLATTGLLLSRKQSPLAPISPICATRNDTSICVTTACLLDLNNNQPANFEL